MAALSIRLPDSYHAMIKQISSKDKISINQFVISAVAEKISAMETQEYLESRAAKGSKAKFMNVLAKVPDVPAEEIDS